MRSGLGWNSFPRELTSCWLCTAGTSCDSPFPTTWICSGPFPRFRPETELITPGLVCGRHRESVSFGIPQGLEQPSLSSPFSRRGRSKAPLPTSSSPSQPGSTHPTHPRSTQPTQPSQLDPEGTALVVENGGGRKLLQGVHCSPCDKPQRCVTALSRLESWGRSSHLRRLRQRQGCSRLPRGRGPLPGSHGHSSTGEGFAVGGRWGGAACGHRARRQGRRSLMDSGLPKDSVGSD